jgi:hypothetical protein
VIVVPGKLVTLVPRSGLPDSTAPPWDRRFS